MKVCIVIVLLVVAVLLLLSMLSVLKQNKDNPEDFRKRFQEHLDITYAKHGDVIGYHLYVAEWTKKICIITIILCILALIF